MSILIRGTASIGGFEVYRVVEPLNIGGTRVGFSGPDVRLGQGVRLWASGEAILVFHTVSPCLPPLCMPRRPLSRTALHTIGVRRRGDPDVLDLLHEIRRLHEALADLYDLIEPLPKVQFGVQQLA